MHRFASASGSESAVHLHADVSLTYDPSVEIEIARETCVHCVSGSETPFFSVSVNFYDALGIWKNFSTVWGTWTSFEA